MDKEDVVNINSGILALKMSEIMSFAAIWMQLEIIILSEVCQKEKSEKVGLNFNIQKTKIMASGPITSSQTDGEPMETVTDFIWGRGASKITADGDYNHEIKRCLLLGRKVITNLDSILKSRTLLRQLCPSYQSYGFSNSHVWM